MGPQPPVPQATGPARRGLLGSNHRPWAPAAPIASDGSRASVTTGAPPLPSGAAASARSGVGTRRVTGSGWPSGSSTRSITTAPGPAATEGGGGGRAMGHSAVYVEGCL